MSETYAKCNDKNDRHRRTSRGLEPRPVFYIASEGENTEPDYFEIILAGHCPDVRIEILKETPDIRGNDPIKLKERIQKKLRGKIDKRIISRCEAWVVVDRDEKTWTVEQLNEVANWVSAENKKKAPDVHGMALSNPCFEFWLLLHFKEGTGALDSKNCKSKLKKELELGYKNKRLNDPKVRELFTKKAIKDAIKRSKIKNKDLDEPWPRQPGHTTMHILVQHILDAADNISKQSNTR